MLAEDETTRWLTEPFPAGVHGRPDGSGGGSTLLMLFNYETHGFEEPVFPLPDKPYYPEIVLRGMAAMVPGIAAYVDKGVRPWVDGGYYVKTRENRPLIGPSGVDGLILSAAYSGFGIMAAMAGAELAGRYVTGADLPDYAPAFRLDRYGDAGYVAGLDAYADGGQL